MKITLLNHTDGKFKAVCQKCNSENVNMFVGNKIVNYGFGTEQYTTLSLKCGDCKEDWIAVRFDQITQHI